MEKSRGFHFTRGLRTHRYHCVALWAFIESKPSQLSKPSQPFKLSQPLNLCKPSQLSKPSQLFKLSQPLNLCKPSQPFSISFKFVLHFTLYMLHSQLFSFSLCSLLLFFSFSLRKETQLYPALRFHLAISPL